MMFPTFRVESISLQRTGEEIHDHNSDTVYDRDDHKIKKDDVSQLLTTRKDPIRNLNLERT